jgi:sec-independent protein translocase protein TatB
VSEVGITEIFLIAVIGLIVVGPEKLPGLAAKAGKTLAYARRTINNITLDVKRELEAEKIAEKVGIDPELAKSFEEIQKSAMEAMTETERATLSKGQDVKRPEHDEVLETASDSAAASESAASSDESSNLDSGSATKT